MRRLEGMIWETPRPVQVAYAGVQAGALTASEASAQVFSPVDLPFHWGRLMQMGWFQLQFPAENDGDAGRTRYLRWHDQGEGTLYVDGVPYYGFDVAHKVCPLPEGVSEGLMEGLCLQSGIWHPEAKGLDAAGSRLTVAEVVVRNDAAWDAYFDLEVLVNLAKDEAARVKTFGGLSSRGEGNKAKVDVVTPLLRRILRVLDDAMMAFDAGGVSGLAAALKQGMAGLRGASPLVKGVLTGHAHIDLVWLWNERSAAYKARHTFASMNTLMAHYPDFHFAYSQSASYDTVAQISPALMERVRARVAEGRWEAVGATYVESDTLIACGEALARSFLVGQERFLDLFGESSRLLWLPDVFGYAGCLPQIMRQCGVDRFFTTKLTWSNIQLFPHSSFRWRGTDGSEVLTHVTQGLGYNQNANADEIRKAADEYRQSDVHDEYLLPTGFGDGGGGVTPEMCERARRVSDLAGVPSTRWGRLGDFYDRLEGVRDQLPIYQGELYLEYHRGTYTTHSDLKRDFRGLERALQLQEAAHVLTGAGPVDVHAWQRLVFAQFHDYIPGSSVWEVYEAGLPELRDLARKAVEAAQTLLGDQAHVTNPLPMARPYLQGNQVVTLPPLSACAPEGLTGHPVALPAQAGNGLRSERVAVQMNERGEIQRLCVDGRPVLHDDPLNQLVVYPDYPHHYDAWEIDLQTLKLGRVVSEAAVPVDWTPPDGCAGLAYRRRIGEKSTVEIRYSVDALHPVVQVELLLDWQEEHMLLKAHFPTKYLGRYARYGSPFNSVLRGQLPGDPRDEAMFEVCGSRWALVMDDAQAEGLSLITEAKYGFSCLEGNLGLSVIRSAKVTGEDEGHGQVVTHSLREGGARSVFSDQGTHHIRYALGAWQSGAAREETPPALADLLYTPCLPAARSMSAGLRGLRGGDSLVPAWAKPLAEGGWVLRLHETLGKSGTVTLDLASGWTARQTCLGEDTLSDPLMEISFRAYEIVSVQLMPH